MALSLSKAVWRPGDGGEATRGEVRIRRREGEGEETTEEEAGATGEEEMVGGEKMVLEVVVVEETGITPGDRRSTEEGREEGGQNEKGGRGEETEDRFSLGSRTTGLS